MASSSSKPTVVLVHGAWADGSSWQRVIAILLERGVPVVAVQNPTTSLDADVAATQLVLASIDGPVVLVGHSWGGAVITQAGNDPKVRALVYVAAFAPDVGKRLAIWSRRIRRRLRWHTSSTSAVATSRWRWMAGSTTSRTICRNMRRGSCTPCSRRFPPEPLPTRSPQPHGAGGRVGMSCRPGTAS